MNRTAWMILSLATTMLFGMMSGPSDTKATTTPAVSKTENLPPKTKIEATVIVLDAVRELRTEVSQLRTQFNAEQLSRAVKDTEHSPASANESSGDGAFVPLEGPVDMRFVNMHGAVCTSGSCGVVSRSSYAGQVQVRRGLFGRRIVVTPNSSSSGQRRLFANRGPGNRFPILGRLFGRRR